MRIGRLLKHLFLVDRPLRRAFDASTLAAIEEAIGTSEKGHGGEIRFVIEDALPLAALWHDVSPRERAVQVFSQLRVWDTAANNGVLIYVLWADRDVEIVADRGLDGRVSAGQWAEVCHRMEQLFAVGSVREAAVEGIQGVGALLAQHFPAGDRDEESNRPVVL